MDSNRAPVPRYAFSIREACDYCGIGRTKFYELLAANEITSIKIGTRRLIRVEVLEAWLKAQEGADV